MFRFLPFHACLPIGLSYSTFLSISLEVAYTFSTLSDYPSATLPYQSDAYLHFYLPLWGGPPNTQNWFVKNCVLILTCINFSHLQSTPHWTHLSRRFPHCSKELLSSSILMPFSASAIFSFHLFHIGKTFPFEDFFHQGGQKNSHSGRDWVNREGGEQGSCCFGSKTAEHSVQCGQVGS